MNRYDLEHKIQHISLSRNQAVGEFAVRLRRYSQPMHSANLFDELDGSEIVGWGLDVLLLTFLQKLNPSPDPRSAQNFVDALQVYNAKYDGANINFDEMVRDGLIRIVWNQWYFPHHLRCLLIGNFKGTTLCVDFYR
ncbi:hypothetical protein [Desulfosporosinus metallidurans]|nr:hypothetical protein [Desulfosporosinus metallidurans]